VRLRREIDLPRGIGWEALVDPVLVGGWLHPDVTLVDGTTGISFVEPERFGEPAVLHVISPVFGDVRIVLVSLEGGRRGESTVLTLTASDEWGRLADRERLWELRLDQLESLLRGHPVDWVAWPHAHRVEDATARLERDHAAR